ncbi:LysR family transcriptional regulator (plasmid) [Mesorhizobium sp. ORM8.1]
MARRRRIPSLTSLRSFEAVARNQSFTNAAEELCVTQGAVSHQVKWLEEQLGIQLLERDSPKISLTKSGEKLLRAASEAFNGIEQAADEIRGDAEGAGESLYLRISSQFSQFWLAPRIREFLRSNPDGRIYVGTSSPELIGWSDRDVISIEPRDATCTVDGGEIVFRSDLMPLCSPYLSDEEYSREDPNRLQKGVLLCERSHDWWSDLSFISNFECLLRGGRLYFEDPGMTVHTAVGGQGWLMGSTTVLRSLLESGKLVAPFDPRMAVPRAYYLDYRPSALKKPLARKFRTWLLDESQAYRH